MSDAAENRGRSLVDGLPSNTGESPETPPAATSLADALAGYAGVCSVCEGHEDDHTDCANAVQHYLGIAEADRERLRGEIHLLREGLRGEGWAEKDIDRHLRLHS